MNENEDKCPNNKYKNLREQEEADLLDVANIPLSKVKDF